MVKDAVEKLNKKYGSKMAWNAADYEEYIELLKSARIENISGLIVELRYWATFTNEEEKHLDKIIEDLNDYLNYLKGE